MADQFIHYEQVLKLIPVEMLNAIFPTIQGDSYEAFLSNPKITEHMHSMMDVDYALGMSTMAMFYHIFLMKRHGEKIFILEPDLALMLANTNINGITGDMLKTPYREQLFVLPDNLDFVSIHDPNTGDHKVRNIYVAYDGSELRLLVAGAANENSSNSLDDAFAYFRYTIDGRDLKQQIQEQIEKNSKSMMVSITGGIHNLDKAERIFNFILNLLIYTTSSEADLYFEGWKDLEPKVARASGKDRKRYIERLKAQNRFLKIRLGRSVRLTAEHREAYMTGRVLAKRTLVMGHWMHYHVGAGRVDTILKWRQPFWRGVGEESNIMHKIGV